jgi:hypothetical protein
LDDVASIIPLAFKNAPSQNIGLGEGVNPPNWLGASGFADFWPTVRRKPSFLE